MNVLQEGEKKEELNKNKFFDTPSCMGWDIIFLLSGVGWTHRLASKKRVCKRKKGVFYIGES